MACVYILDDLLFDATSTYTGEEIKVYPVKLNVFEMQKLKELGLKYTKDEDEVFYWIREKEIREKRSYGGYMMMGWWNSIKLDINWDKLKIAKEQEEKEIKRKTLKLQ